MHDSAWIEINVIFSEAALKDGIGGDGDREFVETVRVIAALEAWNIWSDDPKVARGLLARLFCALSSAGQSLRVNRVDSYNEFDLDAQVQAIGTGLDSANGAFWPDFDRTPAEEIFDATFLAMRMLDATLSLQTTVIMPETLEEFVADAGYFVVPCRKVAGVRDGMKGQGLSRRGLLHHRIAPLVYDGVRLALHVHPDVGLRPDYLPPRRRVGAGVFQGLRLETQLSEINGLGNFVVTGLKCEPSQELAVADQCRSAVADQCDTLVWPELTMPPERVEQVRDHLREKPLNGDRPPVVVAGSWHVKCGERIRNRSEVLDGRGERLFWFDKCLAYLERGTLSGAAEDIEYGETVQLLLAEDELIVFQICLDFCHVDREALLKACDASLVIVPSMGAGSTIRDHIARAAVLQTANNTRTVVVQQRPKQSDASDFPAIGYILPGVTKPRDLSEDDILTSQCFSSFYTEGEESPQ